MPKYYCDYCDTHLTHHSSTVRKTHCNGRKHRENVKLYYQAWVEEETQKLVDKTTAAYKSVKLRPVPYGPMPLPPFHGGVGMLPANNMNVPRPGMVVAPAVKMPPMSGLPPYYRMPPPPSMEVPPPPMMRTSTNLPTPPMQFDPTLGLMLPNGNVRMFNPPQSMGFIDNTRTLNHFNRAPPPSTVINDSYNNNFMYEENNNFKYAKNNNYSYKQY